MGLLTGDKKQEDVNSPLSAEHKARVAMFTQYWNYYRGRHRKPLKVKAGQVDNNVIVNHSRKIVNTGVNFLFGKDFTFDVEGDGGDEQLDYINKVWAEDADNKFSKLDFLQGTALNGAIAGSPFIRLYPADSPNGRDELPRFVNIDPSMVDVITKPDDKDMVIEYRIVWLSGDEVWKRHRFVQQEDETWQIVEEVQRRGSQWTVENEEHWPYQFAPLFECQNLKDTQSFWGISDLEDADLNDAVNATGSDINRILHFHAYPRTIGLGMSADEIQATGIDNLWTIQSSPTEANVFNLEMQSDLASSREHQRGLTEAFYNVSDVPLLDVINTQVGALSGFALQILYGALLAKTESKRRRYGGMLIRLNKAVLELNGMKPVQMTINWQNPLPSNAGEKAALFVQYAAVGSAYGAAKVSGHSEDEANLLAGIDMSGLTRSGLPVDVEVAMDDTPENVSSAGLNGAQIRAVLDVLANIREGGTPKEVGEELLIAAGIDPKRASKIVSQITVGGTPIITAGKSNGTT